MADSPSADAASFRRILTRNILLPVGIGIAGAAVFVAVILHLLSVIAWVEHTDRVINGAGDTSRMAVEQESAMRAFLVGGNEVFTPIFEEHRTRMLAGLRSLEELVQDNPAQVQRLRRIADVQADWNRYAETVMRQKRENGPFTETMTSGQGRRMADEVRREFAQFGAEEERLRRERNEQAQTTAIWILVGYVTFTVLTSLLLAWAGRRELLGLATSYDAVIAQQAKHSAEQERQAWLRSGQSQLAERLIGQSQIGVLGRGALDFLAGYLGFKVAALYHRLPDGRLQRVAAWGMGEGEESLSTDTALALEAVRGNQIIELDALPVGYLRVNSGVAGGPSQSALIVPLAADGEVNGVIEAGFLRPLSPRDREMLTLVSTGLATAINTALYRQRLQDA
ncbi:MAG: two-component system sensor histidine kinase/response regulator, partial [Burkholderiales bacterium]